MSSLDVGRATKSRDLAAARELTLEYMLTWYAPGDVLGAEDNRLLDGFLEQFSEPEGAAFVASVDGIPQGSVLVAQGPEGCDHLLKLYVRPGYRGRGLGGRLVDEAVKWSASGLRDCQLIVQCDRRSAISIYAARGFVESVGVDVPAGYRSMTRYHTGGCE